MNIALICPRDFTAYLCCQWIIKYLLKKKHKIFLITTLTEDSFFHRELCKLKIKIIPVNMNRHLNIFDDIKYLISLYLIFKKYKISNVFSFCTKPNIYSPIAAKLAGIKEIYISIWGRGTSFLKNNSIKFTLLKTIVLIFYKIAFILSDKIWFTNKNDLKYFQSKKIINLNKVILTRNYIDTDIYNPKKINNKRKDKLIKELRLKKNTPVVILVGRMIFSKGIKEFIDSSLIVKKVYKDIIFILIGPEEKNNPDSVPSNYLKKLNKLPKYKHIKWLGFRNDIKELYSISKIAVLPSYYPEGGFPRAITEPMSMAKAVIASNSEDCKGPIDENIDGLLIPPKDKDQLAEKILMLLSNPKMLRSISKKAREKVIREFDEKVIISKLIEEFY